MRWYFLGAMAGAAVVAGIVFLYIRSKVKRFTRRHLGGVGLSDLLQAAQEAPEEAPKSLSGGDALIAPRILRDFPDFNLTQAKTLARKELESRLSAKKDLKIHKVILHDYQRAGNEKTIIFQAAAQYAEGAQTVQRRYCLHYAYLLPQDAGATVAGSCPNCGAAFTSTAQTRCPYCGSLVANVLGNTWQFTDFYEK